ncbi:hypothetical protein Ancab_013851 [Ancistrocladus abbreviatus]
MTIEEEGSEEELAKKRRAMKKGSSDHCVVFPPIYISRGRGSDDDAEDMGKVSTGIGEVEVYTEHGVDHPVFVNVLLLSTSEAIPQNEEGLTQEANLPEFDVENGDEDWSTDNVLEEELGSDFDELFKLRRQNFIRKQDKKWDILGMMADDKGAEDDSNIELQVMDATGCGHSVNVKEKTCVYKCLATTDAPQPKKSRDRPRKSSNNPSSTNPTPTME